MLLAEALAARKDALTQIKNLGDRLTAAVLRYEDQSDPPERPHDVVRELADSLDRLEVLTVRINRTNNETRLAFDGRDLTVMEAIALRERLTLEARARRAAVEALERVTGSKVGRGLWLGRRTREDVREIPTGELGTERKAADDLSEGVRRLDLLLQQRNWTTELL